MSVIIPNMNMPMSCLACPLAREMFGCLVCVGFFKDNLIGRRVYKSDLKESDTDFNRPAWCPLIPFPEGHWRLIDADKLTPDIVNYIAGGYGGTVGSMCTMRGYSQREIDNAPTILEAEVKKDG